MFCVIMSTQSLLMCAVFLILPLLYQPWQIQVLNKVSCPFSAITEGGCYRTGYRFHRWEEVPGV